VGIFFSKIIFSVFSPFRLDQIESTHDDYTPLVYINQLQLINQIQDLVLANSHITDFCTIPEAVIYLETGDKPPIHRRQYPVAHALIYLKKAGLFYNIITFHSLCLPCFLECGVPETTGL
jgi:hypothetical protein